VQQQQQQRQWKVRDRVTIAISIICLFSAIYHLSSLTGEQFGAQSGPLRPPSPSGRSPARAPPSSARGPGSHVPDCALTQGSVEAVEVTRALTKP
jgi:hypothetical protein